ncbi:ATP-binding cassette sub-family B member 10, mitochondrial-like isoform X2 [Stegodyphus dumicola]|nr:ATP-binding cassette sub-family B member 10, mitochondrial-like isoform X2 [Stegodyphus dumicola]XP_035224928.1 ATP-binding cassette sub-family B member 10, mitochondrial-like isoform X2 [Stegodyphus dumicola]
MAVPFCVGKLIDILSSSKEDMKNSLIGYCQVLVLIFAVGALANLGRVYLMNTSSYRIVNSLRKRAYRSILSQEVGFFDCTSTGELINRLSSDTAAVGTSITNNVSDGMRSAFSFIASSSLMVFTSPSLAMLGLMTVTPVAVIAVVSGKSLKRNSQQVQSALASATQVAEERLSNIRTVHAFARLNEEYDLFQSKVNSIMQFATKEALGRAVFFGMVRNLFNQS